MCKAKLFEILRDIGEEIPDNGPTPKKCHNGRKKIYAKTVVGIEYVNTTSRSPTVL